MLEPEVKNPEGKYKGCFFKYVVEAFDNSGFTGTPYSSCISCPGDREKCPISISCTGLERLVDVLKKMKE
jgi:hypothetical protein